MILHTKITKDDLGKTRTRDKFAWLPIRLTNGKLVWLEMVFINEVARKASDMMEIGDGPDYYLWEVTYKGR